MNSNYMKAILCQYFRYNQSCKYVATEAGMFNSDFLAIKKNNLYEVEIKISKADLSNDFKKDKHKKYNSGQYIKYCPTYFYFAVPSELVQFALSKVEGTKYGVIEVYAEDKKKRQELREHIETDLLEEKLAYIKEEGGEIVNVRSAWNGELRLITYNLDVPMLPTDRINIVKRASKLHTKDVSEQMRYDIVARCSSELAKLKYENYLLKNKKIE